MLTRVPKDAKNPSFPPDYNRCPENTDFWEGTPQLLSQVSRRAPWNSHRKYKIYDLIKSISAFSTLKLF